MVKATRFSVEPMWRIILKDLGVNESEVLQRAELPGDIFARKNATFSTDEYFNFWKSIEESVEDATFPLKIGQIVSTEAFSPPIFAALCSPNLNIAMQRLSKYKQLVGPFTLDVAIDEQSTAISFGCLYTDKPLPESLLAAEQVFTVHLVRLATRENITPLSVVSTSGLANDSQYAEYFGVVPVQGQNNELRFSAADAKRPFLTDDGKMWEFFEPELRKRLSEIDAEAPFSSRVKSTLYELLPSGMGGAEEVARKLAVSKRTMQRHLGSEQTTFQQVLNETREQLARHYLENSGYSGTQIAFLLGFDDPNSFIRAFRIWTGETPEQMRANITH